MMFAQKAQTFAIRFLALFTVGFMLTFPTDITYIPHIAQWLSPFFEGWARYTGQHLLGLPISRTYALLSDTTGTYVHLLNLATLSVVIAVVWSYTKKNELTPKLKYWYTIVVAYYLSLQLFIYGCSKVFKWQFYLPEPNTLYTPLGYTHKDLLFWSTMGTSYPYTIFSGVIELLPAVLLLFKRTRIVGALIAAAVLVNVVMLNFSYDISVKIFSLFLLLLCFVLLAYYNKPLWGFITQKPFAGQVYTHQLLSSPKRKHYVVAKTIVIVFIVFDALAPYFITNNFNDDTFPRPALHGAYQVTTHVHNGDTLAPLLTNSRYIKKVFINRKGYLITQSANDFFADYKLDYLANNTLQITNYYTHTSTLLTCNKDDEGIYTFSGEINRDSVVLKTKKIPLQKLPLLQKEVHWIIDGD